jgi:glycosyltransferase involved in cell wall biosynthesis
MRVALGSVPKDGGTFTFYRNLRPTLLGQEIELRCVTLGQAQNRLWDDAFADTGCHRLGPDVRSLKAQARLFVDWCADEQIDLVIGINSEGILAAIPHLPSSVSVIARCANGFEEGYQLTMAGGARLARIVALTPRLRDDLVGEYGADPDRVVLIPNGINAEPFELAARRPRGTGALLELVFLGRLEHNQKGVLHLPPIVRALRARGIPFRLRIAGKGKHEPQLRRELAPFVGEGTVAFEGPLSPEAVPRFLGAADIFVFTSHFEGCPNALLEAMMAGAVPICWRLPGITDYLIEHGMTGFLSEVGDTEGFATFVADLSKDRARLDCMRQTTAAMARARFAIEIAGQAYGDLFRSVMSESAPAWTPRAWSDFQPEAVLLPRWKERVPEPIRRGLRPLARTFTRIRHGAPRHSI